MLARRKKTPAKPSVVTYTYIGYDEAWRSLVPGTVVRSPLHHGERYKFVRACKHNESGKEWMDFIQVPDKTNGQTRAFHREDVIRIARKDPLA